MKKTIQFLGFLSFSTFTSQHLIAQAPKLFNYQAVIRSGSGEVIANANVSLRISVIQGDLPGAIVYSERHNSTTNAFGQVNLIIGNGAVLAGAMESIEWASGKHFLKIEFDPSGGSSFIEMGVTQLISVPFSMHAQSAASIDYNDITNAPVIDGSETRIIAGTNITITGTGKSDDPYTISSTGGISGPRYLGEEYLDGIIFYLYFDENAQQRGLIVSKTETIAKWQTIDNYILDGANRSEDGKYNFDKMTNSPAKEWVINNFSTEWYIPSIDEFNLLWQNRFHVNRALRALGLITLAEDISLARYWSSTESSYADAMAFQLLYGGISGWIFEDKGQDILVRAIRAF